mmetsp:Transcript_52305/g.106620  ORF Transcript_52305/g.106620 Transcript_52305/m.106620 type:complete len:241 (-) Transcript_52305:990-1712(-)
MFIRFVLIWTASSSHGRRLMPWKTSCWRSCMAGCGFSRSGRRASSLGHSSRHRPAPTSNLTMRWPANSTVSMAALLAMGCSIHDLYGKHDQRLWSTAMAVRCMVVKESTRSPVPLLSSDTSVTPSSSQSPLSPFSTFHHPTMGVAPSATSTSAGSVYCTVMGGTCCTMPVIGSTAGYCCFDTVPLDSEMRIMAHVPGSLTSGTCALTTLGRSGTSSTSMTRTPPTVKKSPISNGLRGSLR